MNRKSKIKYNKHNKRNIWLKFLVSILFFPKHLLINITDTHTENKINRPARITVTNDSLHF